MPKISSQRLAARRRGIVRSAARCFERNGLHRTGMRDLLRAANLSPGALYRYFASKEELIAAVAALAPEAIESGPEAAGEEPLEQLLAATAEAPQAGLQLELRASALHSARVAAALRDRRRRARRRLAERLSGAGVGADERLAELVLAMRDGLSLARLLEPESDATGLRETAAELLAAVLARPSGRRSETP